MIKKTKCQYWNRRCKTLGCFGVARACSEYCIQCKKKKEVKKNGNKTRR